MADEPQIPPCIFCEKRAKLHQPVIGTAFYMQSPAGLVMGQACVHISCLVEAIAGRTAEAVIDALRDGEPTGLVAEDGESLDDVVTRVVGAVVNKYTR